MSLIHMMTAKPQPGRYVHGECPHCHKAVYEELWLLDDAYNVWAGKCPHCDAISYLALTSLRGYTEAGMDLVLPSDEEAAANELPAGTPTRGSVGPTDIHGTIAGEIFHKIASGELDEELRKAISEESAEVSDE